MLSATATWKNGTTVTEWFFQESERIVWIAELKATCKAKNLNLPELTTGDDSGEPRKKLWGRIGMTADITEWEFDYLQSGGLMAEVLVRNLFQAGRFRLDGETIFPESSGDDVHENGNVIYLDL